MEYKYYWGMTPINEYKGPVGELTTYRKNSEGEVTRILGSADLYYDPLTSQAIGEAYYRDSEGIGYDQFIGSFGPDTFWFISKAYEQIEGVHHAIPEKDSYPLVGKFWDDSQNNWFIVPSTSNRFKVREGCGIGND